MRTKRAWGPTRFARGSLPPDGSTNWLHVAIRARFPKLAAALGDQGFAAMLEAYMTHEPQAQRSLAATDAGLAQYLAESCDYPLWYSELATLDRAHVHVLHAPKVEVQENGKTYTITVELPGVEQKDVKVLVEDDVLTISGEKHVERTDEKTHYSERSYGSFTRAFTLPSDADRNDISANFSKGLLTLQIAKTAGRPERTRQIDVQPS